MTGNPSGKSAANLESRLRRPLTNSKAALPSALVSSASADRCGSKAMRLDNSTGRAFIVESVS
jgi:hypothetical protein